MDDSRIKDVSSLLSSFFDEEKRREGEGYAGFFGSWKRIAGERLAAHSRVKDIENDILVIEADHPGWIQLLQFRQAEMLNSARALYPELNIRGISFKLAQDKGSAMNARPGVESDSKPRPGPFGPGGRTPCEEPQATEKEGIGSLEDIQDPELRRLLGELKKTVDGGR
jgi:hypothetical protein